MDRFRISLSVRANQFGGSIQGSRGPHHIQNGTTLLGCVLKGMRLGNLGTLTFDRCAAAVLLSVLVLVVGCTPGPDSPRLIVLGIDGLDPLAIDLLMSEGELPNLAQLRAGGASGRLWSDEPRLSPILWTTIATGRHPVDHGISGFAAYNKKTGKRFPVTSEMRRVKALWNITSDHRRKSAVVGWWATWPAEPIHGCMVSDHVCYHFLFPQGVEGGVTDKGLTFPPELKEEIEGLVLRPGGIDSTALSRFVEVPDVELDRPFAFDDALWHFRWVLATSESYRRIGLEMWRREKPDLLMVYIEGVDSASHLFGHLFRGTGFSGELAEQQHRFGNTVEEMYRYADEIVGDFLREMDENTTLVVLSDHGFMLGELHDDLGVTRDMRRVSAGFHRPDGVLFLTGRGVNKGARIQDAQQVDIVPTLLGLLNIPIARDLPGRVLVEALHNPPGERTVDTHEPLNEHAGSESEGSNLDSQILEHLEALGYLADSGTGEADETRAALVFHAGRYEEAITMYRELIESTPNNPLLRVNLAGALGAMGRLDEALEELNAALAMDGLLPEAYHNRGRIYEKTGMRDEAIEQYRFVLRFAPHFDPSRNALRRIGVAVTPPLPDDPRRREAIGLASAAGETAKHGDLDRAGEMLDRAEELDPDLASIYQHRSNIAFMRGDLVGALEAVDRALELVPDDPLYQHNRRELLAQIENRRLSVQQQLFE